MAMGKAVLYHIRNTLSMYTDVLNAILVPVFFVFITLLYTLISPAACIYSNYHNTTCPEEGEKHNGPYSCRFF